MLRTVTSQSTRSARKALLLNPVANITKRQFSQVDYHVYKGNQEHFDRLNKLKEHRAYNRSKNFKWYLLTFVLGAAISYNYSVHEIVDKLFTAKLPQTEAEKLMYLNKLESQLQSLPIVQSLSADPRYKSFRSYELLNQISTVPTVSQDTIHQTLTAPGGVAIAPLYFINKEGKEAVTVVHLGKKLSGYPFLVHGGMLGLVVDEVVKNNCASSYEVDPSGIHTVSLETNYKFPTLADNFVVIKSKYVDSTVNHDEKLVSGSIETPTGRTLVKSKAILQILPGTLSTREVAAPVAEPAANETKRGWFWF
ncbi:unnamed protein product [Ambrosiozyma monospora]|uniref:Unnamed protein product n=1 Tax=Ambrosiozyma monospora TaxID=43982 RepID=A0A9W7DJ94_AMBMO|nr:unnamed protein product [Ambrosiozyma monospora]